jgi:hypothetical protein
MPACAVVQHSCFILQELVNFRDLICGFLVDEYGTAVLCDFLLIVDVASWFVHRQIQGN